MSEWDDILAIVGIGIVAVALVVALAITGAAVDGTTSVYRALGL